MIDRISKKNRFLTAAAALIFAALALCTACGKPGGDAAAGDSLPVLTVAPEAAAPAASLSPTPSPSPSLSPTPSPTPTPTPSPAPVTVGDSGRAGGYTFTLLPTSAATEAAAAGGSYSVCLGDMYLSIGTCLQPGSKLPLDMVLGSPTYKEHYVVVLGYTAEADAKSLSGALASLTLELGDGRSVSPAVGWYGDLALVAYDCLADMDDEPLVLVQRGDELSLCPRSAAPADAGAAPANAPAAAPIFTVTMLDISGLAGPISVSDEIALYGTLPDGTEVHTSPKPAKWFANASYKEVTMPDETAMWPKALDESDGKYIWTVGADSYIELTLLFEDAPYTFRIHNGMAFPYTMVEDGVVTLTFDPALCE